MADFLQDLVQNIYTYCDMDGFNDYNKAIKNMQAQNRAFTRDEVKAQKQRISLNEYSLKSQIRLADFQERYAIRKKRRDDQENFMLQKRLWLWHRLVRLASIYLGFNAIRGIVNTASRIQLVQKSIEGLTKSTQDWEFIKSQAFEKGIDLETVAKGYRNFYSSAKMAGFEKGSIQQMYADMLLSTRAIGATKQQTEGALLALEQMISKGTVSMEELRRQLGNALPGAFEIGAKAMNMTTKEFNAFVRTGKLASAEFVPKFIEQLKKEYAGGFKDVANTIDFASKRVRVAWQLFQTEIFEGETGKGFAQAINTLAKLLVSPEFKTFAKNIGKIFALVMKLLDFTIKHLNTILILIGTGGLMALLPKIAVLLNAIGISLSAIFSTGIIRGLTILTSTLWGMLAPIAALYSKILLVASALILLKDVYDAIVHPDWDTLTRREWEGKNTSFGASQTSLNPFNTVKNVGQNSQIMESIRNRPAEIYANPKFPNVLPSLFNKDTTQNTNVNIGDVHVTSSNANPVQVASEVTKQLVALFTGHGLTINSEGTII